MKPVNRLAVVSFLLASFAVLYYCCSPVSQTAKELHPESPFLNVYDNVKYVGSEACRTCHAANFESFHHTGMGQSFGPATQQKSAADFANHQPVFDSFQNMWYYPFWSNGQFFIKEYRIVGADTVYKRIEKIAYIIGSGQHTNSHLLQENGYVFQAPLTYYTQKKTWDLPPGFENGNNSRFGRRINSECITCHNSFPDYVQGSENQFVNMPFGIGCERCHGPGALHVAEKKKGIIVDTSLYADYTIVNPKRLPWKKQIDLCQRCHLQGNAVLKPGKTFFDFKPGMELSEVMYVFVPEYLDKNNSFIMASHAERLQMSNCFTKSNPVSSNNQYNPKLNFTCINCHNPHVSVKETNTSKFNLACTGCHSENKTLCSETESVLIKNKNNCVSCHMPLVGAEDIPHVSVHDHYIRKPQPNLPFKNSPLKGLWCVNDSNPGGLVLLEAYITYYEKFEQNKLYLEKASELLKNANLQTPEGFRLHVHFLTVKRNFTGIVAIATDTRPDAVYDAWTAYRIGTAMFEAGNKRKEEVWMRRAVELEPSNLEFIYSDGLAKYRAGKYTLAQATFNDLIKKYSSFYKAYVGLALTYTDQKNYTKATMYYNKALALEPDSEFALSNYADLLSITGNKVALEKVLKRLVELFPDSQRYQKALQAIR